MVKRGGERMLDTLKFLGECAVALDVIFLPRPRGRVDKTGEGVLMLPAPKAIPSGSPLDNVGPVPDELRKDPFPGGSVPWSIQEAEREHNQARKTMIWKIAAVVSWSVTLIAALRALGML